MKQQNNINNKTWESHPNLSIYKKQGKTNNNPFSDIESDSDWEDCKSTKNEARPSQKQNIQTVKSKKEQEMNEPLRLAPDPAQKYFEKENKERDTYLNPQRYWEPERYPSRNSNNQIINNLPSHQDRVGVSHVASGRNQEKTKTATPQEQKRVEKKAYHISSVGEDGEEVIEEQSVCEDGFQVYHSSTYKKKMKRLEKLENEQILDSMKRKIATRFLLTKVKPNMTKESVEAYILQNFDIDEVYVRKNPMKFPYYSSFIFITITEVFFFCPKRPKWK